MSGTSVKLRAAGATTVCMLAAIPSAAASPPRPATVARAIFAREESPAAASDGQISCSSKHRCHIAGSAGDVSFDGTIRLRRSGSRTRYRLRGHVVAEGPDGIKRSKSRARGRISDQRVREWIAWINDPRGPTPD